MALKGFADIKETKKSSSHKHQFKIVDLGKYTDTEQYFRPVGYVYAERIHWLERNVKGKVVKFPAPCCNHNRDTDTLDDKGCPYCKANAIAQTRYYVRVINRDAVDNEPKKLAPRTDYEKKKHSMDGIEGIHYKEAGSRSWSPVEVLSLPYGAAKKLMELEKLKGVVVSKKTGKKKYFPFGDEKYGCDICIVYNKDKKSDAYKITFEKRSPLTEEELNYLYPSFEDEFPIPDVKHEKEEYAKIKDTLILNNDDSEKQAQKTISSLSDDEDEDEDEDRIPDEDFETPKKKKVVEEDDDEDDLDEDDSEDEDDSDDDSEDESYDEEDDEDDEDEEEQPKKKKKSKSEDDDDGFEF